MRAGLCCATSLHLVSSYIACADARTCPAALSYEFATPLLFSDNNRKRIQIPSFFPNLLLSALNFTHHLPHNPFFSKPAFASSTNMSEVTVGAYLFQRLKQLGVKTIFGVPGGKKKSQI